MSIGLASVLVYCAVLTVAWFFGMLASRLSRSKLALIAAGLLMLPGAALLIDAPIHVIGIDGEENWGFLFLAGTSLLVSLVGITLALINRSRFQSIDLHEEEY